MKRRVGRPPTHGAYALLQDMARGTLDRRSREARAVRRVKRDLVRHLGAAHWGDLDLRQRLLVEQAAVLAVVTSLMAARALADGVIDKGGSVNQIFGKKYLAYANAFRRCLEALGVKKGEKGASGGPDIGELLAQQGDDSRESDRSGD